MANPTSNFGWQMPTATDLVTDLPADFEVFGQAVDTDFVDLLGGTTGQILAKNSGTDMDFIWITNDVGDITEVAAGTGISGGGTSGAVTVTNSMATAIDAKGDLIGGTGADAFARLGVGANGTVLTADSVETTGMKWVVPAAGGITLIDEIAFSTTQTVNVNDVFSASYVNYLILVDGTLGSCSMTLMLRVGGSDTSTNYDTQEAVAGSTSMTVRENLFGTDEFYVGPIGSSTEPTTVQLHVSRPFLTTPTAFNSNYGGVSQVGMNGGTHSASTSFTGFSALFDANATGTLYIYGFGKE